MLHAFTARGRCVLDNQLAGASTRFDQGGVGLLVVPGIRIAAPFATVEMQHLGLEPLPRSWVAMFHLHRKGFHQNRVDGEFQRAAEHRADHLLRGCV